MSATRLLTTEQLAARIGKSPSTVNRWALAGRITPVMQLPGRTGDRLYDPAIVDELEETNERN